VLAYLARRLLLAVPTLFGVLAVTFLLLFVAPFAAAEVAPAPPLSLAEAVEQALARNERAAIADAWRDRAFADARGDLARALPAADLSAVWVRRDEEGRAGSGRDAAEAGSS